MEAEFLQNFIGKFTSDGDIYDKFFTALRSGTNKIVHNTVSENFQLDENWIYTIEGGLYSIEAIIRNPRKFIREEEVTVDVARAKRTTSKTVRHLASHTQYVEAAEEDNVRPKKVLVAEIEEDIAIYENRFVFALINKLNDFVERRNHDIQNRAESADYTNLNVNSEFNVGKNNFKCNLEIKVKEPTHDEENLEVQNGLLEKISLIRKRIQLIKQTAFYHQLTKSKPVKPPIQKTNLLRMNVDYRNCYNLWLFISAYNHLGFSIHVTEKDLPVEGDYYDDLTVVVGLAVQSLVTDGNLRREMYSEIPIKKKQEKDFRLVTNYNFTPDFGVGKENVSEGEDAVNEYYFRQMRDELVRATKRKNDVVETKDLDLNFRHFYRSIAKINGEMYKDIIYSEMPEKVGGRTVIQKREQAVKNQKLLLRRFAQLSKLQRAEFEKTLKMEKRELLKLEKLEEDLQKAKKQRIRKQEAAQKKKLRLKKIEDRERDAIISAEAYERDLRGVKAAKTAQKDEERRLRREEAKRERELKKLQELKDKYDGEE